MLNFGYLRWNRDCGFKLLHLESDFRVAIHLLTKACSFLHPILALVQFILKLASLVDSSSWKHVCRECYSAAGAFFKHALSMRMEARVKSCQLII